MNNAEARHICENMRENITIFKDCIIIKGKYLELNASACSMCLELYTDRLSIREWRRALEILTGQELCLNNQNVLKFETTIL